MNDHVAWLVGNMRRNPSHTWDRAVGTLTARHGPDVVGRFLAIEYERADGTRWRHEAGDRGAGVVPETRPEYLVADGSGVRFRGPMFFRRGRGLIG